MIQPDSIVEILRTYQKHGWTLRRVLASADLKAGAGESFESLFGDSECVDSDLDAAWFSRARDTGSETWEIRHLSESPFALLTCVDTSADVLERNAVLSEVEYRLREKVTRKKSSTPSDLEQPFARDT